MELKLITSNDKEWKDTIEYARNCTWKAGRSLSDKMSHDYFNDWQRVMIVIDDHQVIAFCIFTKEDGIIGVNYTPYIGYIYVDEKHRGQRISQKMINKAIEYARELNFKAVYIISDHDNLYEKYGFDVYDHKENRHGIIEKIYRKEI